MQDSDMEKREETAFFLPEIRGCRTENAGKAVDPVYSNLLSSTAAPRWFAFPLLFFEKKHKKSVYQS